MYTTYSGVQALKVHDVHIFLGYIVNCTFLHANEMRTAFHVSASFIKIVQMSRGTLPQGSAASSVSRGKTGG